MKPIAQLISLLAILVIIVSCLLYFAGTISHATVTSTSLLGTLAWFAATPIWMGRELPIDADQVEI